MQTRLLADYVCDIRYSGLSERVRDAARKTVLDLIGVAIAGAVTPQAEIWRKYFLADVTTGPCANVWQPNFATSSFRQAAAFNAAVGHILDFDDVHNKSIAHLGVVTVPAALAVAQSRRLGGRTLIESITAGFEIGARVGYSINPGSYRIWHTTGVVGALCSAAATGKLIGLDKDGMLNAFGSAGTQASGLWEFMADSAMSKPLHTANATMCGIRSAELAALGLTGASRILEGDQGLLRALDTQYRPELLVEGLGSEYLIADNSFKLYPCCRHTHSGIYSMEKLIATHSPNLSDIVKIVDRTYSAAKDVTDRADASTPYACKFSMQYCLSAVLARGRFESCIFDDDAVNDPVVRGIMQKVEVVDDPAIDAELARDPACWSNTVEVTLCDGRVLTESTDYPPGDSHTNLSWDAATEKFHSLTDELIGRERALQLADKIGSLDDLDDVNRLFG